MSINSFIQKFIDKGPQKASLSIVMLTDGIYVAKADDNGAETASFYELTDNN
ncbi:hypothetical protein [Vibrio gangliei]|uniref:hypothetical protein n=1 Tax=Vibrio gangliei TaxID=2077090 RepID=UPI0013003824|nr:hypothetical protein [Vibrio gangliei]